MSISKKNSNVYLEKAQGAMLGAAIGDALGWPNENKSCPKNRFSNRNYDNTLQFKSWIKRSGFMYNRYEEEIQAGEYSDDTQLILSVARSLLRNRDWLNSFSRYELPLWLIYERGGGSATKMAASLWQKGIEPWQDKSKKMRYFSAGGNGVAMRILPHVLWRHEDYKFKELKNDIFLNGICTHADPVALIGAILYGFALWKTFRETETLRYGSLLDTLIYEQYKWSEFPDDCYPESWKREININDYKFRWEKTVKEALNLLNICRKAMDGGALSIDDEVLVQLGCFDKNINGAGTVAAAASIFLASRYAADPQHGLLEAAFAYGADTDTIASMTGGLLGAINGYEWLEDSINIIQDANYLMQISKKLIEREKRFNNLLNSNDKFTKKEMFDTYSALKTAFRGSNIQLPSGIKAKILDARSLKTYARNLSVNSWKLKTEDGQTLYIKKVNKKSEVNALEKELELFSTSILDNKENIVKVGLKLFVSNLDRSRCFYEKIIGLDVRKESKSFVNLSGIIALISMQDSDENIKNAQKGLNIYIEVRSLDKVYRAVKENGITIFKEKTEDKTKESFSCLDPDNNIVEITETKN